MKIEAPTLNKKPYPLGFSGSVFCMPFIATFHVKSGADTKLSKTKFLFFPFKISELTINGMIYTGEYACSVGYSDGQRYSMPRSMVRFLLLKPMKITRKGVRLGTAPFDSNYKYNLLHRRAAVSLRKKVVASLRRYVIVPVVEAAKNAYLYATLSRKCDPGEVVVKGEGGVYCKRSVVELITSCDNAEIAGDMASRYVEKLTAENVLGFDEAKITVAKKAELILKITGYENETYVSGKALYGKIKCDEDVLADIIKLIGERFEGKSNYVQIARDVEESGSSQAVIVCVPMWLAMNAGVSKIAKVILASIDLPELSESDGKALYDLIKGNEDVLREVIGQIDKALKGGETNYVSKAKYKVTFAKVMEELRSDSEEKERRPSDDSVSETSSVHEIEEPVVVADAEKAAAARAKDVKATDSSSPPPTYS